MSYVKQGRTIVGIDEVGRGAWAGPVTAAAVILPPRMRVPGLADSKLLSPAAREKLNVVIRRKALAVGIGWVSSEELDANGLTWAVRQSGLRALANMNLTEADYIVILDGKHNYLRDTHQSQAIVKADGTIMPVAAASVIAKVARDRYMVSVSKRTKDYGFESHKGYGTAFHQAALASLGLSSIHRRSFAPIDLLSKQTK